MSTKAVREFIHWYKQMRPEYRSWDIKYFLPTIRVKITVPEGMEVDADFKLTKIVGLGFKPTEFKKIIHLLGERPPDSFLFSENLWLVDEEQKHHLVVGYIIRKPRTLILMQFWLRSEGMYDLIANSPVGIILFSTKSKDMKKGMGELTRIIQSGNGEYTLIVADLEPFKHEEPVKL